ncbi:peptidylprolyl isomerase [candidate division KSB1 bacterium]|nr:peptidylprolyl isomerase [candidate division KSB1 bacterium]
MRRMTVYLLILTTIYFLSCGKSLEPLQEIAKDSAQYQYFKELSKNIPLVDPDRDVLLLETTEFKISTKNILLMIYQNLYDATGGDVQRIKNEPTERIKAFIMDGAQRIAENRLLLLEAIKAGYKVSDDTVKKTLDSLILKAKGEEQFNNELKKRNMTLEDVKRDIADSYILNKYVKEYILASVKVSDSEVMAVYSQDKKATVRHIVKITKDRGEADKAAIRKQIEGILGQLRGGADFAKVAEKYSDDPGARKNGGLIKNIERGALFPNLDNAIFTTPVGETSDIVETELGYHLVKIIERQRDSRPFEEAKKQIIDQLSQPMRQKALQDKIDELKQKYQMKIVALPS